MPMDLQTPVEKLFMVGPTYARRLNRMGIKTAEDLLYHFPFRYDDYSLVSVIKKVQPNKSVTVQGEVIEMKNVYTKNRKKIQKAIVADQTGQIQAIWFNQPFLSRTIKKGSRISLSGKTGWFDRKISLVSPEYELLKEIAGETKSIHTGRLVPVYHETRGVSSKWLRSRIAPLIDKVVDTTTDFLPPELTEKHQLMAWGEAIRQVHFPNSHQNSRTARKRLAFEEMLLIHLATFWRQADWQQKKLAYPLKIDGEKILEFMEKLPFELTKAQKRSLKEILVDLKGKKPMNRLLEGDVGSGKTVVAAAAIYAAYLSGVQSALMAPTEILAHQHFQTLDQLLVPLGIKIKLLTGSSRKKATDFDLVVGTHALIHKRVEFKKLGLAIIDEQHRFGVEQRSKLIKRGRAPHILTMTATPIPRTIALTLYGDLDLSVIDEMPPGRQATKTWVVPPQKRAAAYAWIKKQVKNTANQAFIICPLIEESEHESLTSAKAASAEFKRLKKEVFPDLKLGLLHGRLRSREKNQILDRFKAGKIDILVATPVVEVGIDVPTATIMMIETAERFGLAQLHQLRGRVGRGEAQSYCLLFPELRGRKIYQRLKALERTNIGMELAEIDLKLRGPGEVYGTAQHGHFELKIASFSDLPLIEKTKRAATKLTTQDPRLKKYPLLRLRLKQATIKAVEPN
jgi:ATP-dependent DNA helicase RecG